MEEISYQNLQIGNEYIVFNPNAVDTDYSGKKIGNFTGLDTSYDYESTIDDQTGMDVGMQSESEITLAKFNNLHDMSGEKPSGMGSATENEFNVNEVKFYLPESYEMETGGKRRRRKTKKHRKSKKRSKSRRRCCSRRRRK